MVIILERIHNKISSKSRIKSASSTPRISKQVSNSNSTSVIVMNTAPKKVSLMNAELVKFRNDYAPISIQTVYKNISKAESFESIEVMKQKGNLDIFDII